MSNQQSWERRQDANRARRPLGKQVVMLGDISRELHNQHHDLVRGGMTSEEAAKKLGIDYEVVMV